MEIVCIQGSAPGRIVATVSHGTLVRQMALNVERHLAGGWHVGVGPRCLSVNAAVLLEASEAFEDEKEAVLF